MDIYKELIFQTHLKFILNKFNNISLINISIIAFTGLNFNKINFYVKLNIYKINFLNKYTTKQLANYNFQKVFNNSIFRS
jgi:hypothetical protein